MPMYSVGTPDMVLGFFKGTEFRLVSNLMLAQEVPHFAKDVFPQLKFWKKENGIISSVNTIIAHSKFMSMEN